MPTITTRVDDSTKKAAEEIANEIGISISSAINIFLKKFVSEHGFPFRVIADAKPQPLINEDILDKIVVNAIKDSNDTGMSRRFSYLDPNTNKIVSTERKE